MSGSNERTIALGRYQELKQRVLKLGYRAGSHLQSVHQELNTMLQGKEFTDIDFDEIETLIDSLKKIKEETLKASEEMKQLKETYGL